MFLNIKIKCDIIFYVTKVARVYYYVQIIIFVITGGKNYENTDRRWCKMYYVAGG